METFPIKETIEKLIELEKKYPTMAVRLRWLRALKDNPTIDNVNLVNSLGITEFEMSRWAALYRFGGIELLLDNKTIIDASSIGTKSFSDYALDMLRQLYTEHKEQIGRQLWIDFDNCRNNKKSGTECSLFSDYKEFDMQFKNWRRTDCQTYLQDVIRYSFEKIGKRAVYDGLLGYYKKNGVTGTSMAKYLLTQNWKAYLFSPDIENPINKTYKTIAKDALKTKKWWGVNLSGAIVNYNPNLSVTSPTKLDETERRDLMKLATVKFGACIFSEGIHTGILSEGHIYEVHWKHISEQTTINEKYKIFQKRGNKDLYDRTNILDFGWAEGIIVIPPDTAVGIN